MPDSRGERGSTLAIIDRSASPRRPRIGDSVHVEAHSHGGCPRVRGNSAWAANSGSAAKAPSWSFGEVRSTEAWFREDTEVIDFFAPPRDAFLLGGNPAYINEG